MHSTFDIEMKEYIRGELFEETFTPNANQIFYSKIDNAKYFLQNIGKFIKIPFVFVTHNGDTPVSQSLLDYAKTIPNLKKWFGQNIECAPDTLIESIPIGLENDYNFPHIEKRKKLRLKIEKENNLPTNPKNLLYLNYSFSTNKSEREHSWQTIKKNVRGDVLTDKCMTHVSQEKYQLWLDDVVNHHYVVCPRGNGIDTHRMWETLYLGRIPIVKKEINTKFYKNLPILFVNSWEEVTEPLLKNSLEKLSDSKKYNLEMLKFSYWKEKIMKESNYG